MPSPHLAAPTERQTSRGKFDRFQHTTGGSTSATLMEQHFVAEGPLVPAATGLVSASCSSARAFALRFFQTRPRGRSPCALLPFTSIWLVEDFHLQAVEHARHTFSRLRRETALRGRRLTKGEENERIIINRSGRPTYPEQKSVLTSGATPNFCRRYETTLSS
jgi:hypothetical protein